MRAYVDKDWRPKDWDQIKRQIVEETPVLFSPSVGYTGNQKDVVMEKTASAILKEFIDAEVQGV